MEISSRGSQGKAKTNFTVNQSGLDWRGLQSPPSPQPLLWAGLLDQAAWGHSQPGLEPLHRDGASTVSHVSTLSRCAVEVLVLCKRGHLWSPAFGTSAFFSGNVFVLWK